MISLSPVPVFLFDGSYFIQIALSIQMVKSIRIKSQIKSDVKDWSSSFTVKGVSFVYDLSDIKPHPPQWAPLSHGFLNRKLHEAISFSTLDFFFML